MPSNKYIKAALVFILICATFSFTAFIEYQSVSENNRRIFKDELVLIQTQLNSLLDSRINSTKNLKIFIQSNKTFNQDDFQLYVKEIYESPNQLLKNLTFITDFTITHIYPYEENKSAIGIDLSENEDQRPILLYAKEENKVVVTGPVDLVEGGKAIVVRVPYVIDGSYFGQTAIVFDYDQLMIQSGLDALSEKYFITLSTYDIASKKTNVIYSNSMKEKNNESYDIDLYDFKLTVEGQPKNGWQGISTLFILIIILGHLVAISTFIFLLNAFKDKDKLKASYLALKEANQKLEASNIQLTDNKEDLTHRFYEMQAQKIQIQYLADRDSLTGLYNRRKCFIDLKQHLSDHKKISLILFDIDNFKNINDTRGHGHGDKILTSLSIWLDQFLQEPSTPYRIGGDEFIIVLHDEERVQNIEAFMSKFYEAFETFKSQARFNESLTLSAGIAFSPEQGHKASSLMMKADLAMYASKNKGKNQYAIFDEKMYQNLNEKVHIENLLRVAVKNEDFYLVYQPIITASNYEVYGFEALIRMKDSTMSPAEFIPISEEIGLISTIGKWVIHNVLKQMQIWQDQGLVLKPVAINISPSQIYEGGIEIYLQEQFDLFNVDPKLIELEVTENIFLSNNTNNLMTLEKIKKIGCKLTLDDFGSGYSSLSYLTYMPIQKIKLDKSLKDKFLPYEEIKVMEGLIAFCHSLNLKVVTEGVEDHNETKKLIEQGSDFLQGFVFSRPVLPEEAVKLMYHCYQLKENESI